MKDSEIYLKAAEQVLVRTNYGCCNAIAIVQARVRGRPDWDWDSYATPLHNEAAQLFWPDSGYMDLPLNSKGAKVRSVALCFMAAIAASEGR